MRTARTHRHTRVPTHVLSHPHTHTGDRGPFAQRNKFSSAHCCEDSPFSPSLAPPPYPSVSITCGAHRRPVCACCRRGQVHSSDRWDTPEREAATPLPHVRPHNLYPPSHTCGQMTGWPSAICQSSRPWGELCARTSASRLSLQRSISKRANIHLSSSARCVFIFYEQVTCAKFKSKILYILTK